MKVIPVAVAILVAFALCNAKRRSHKMNKHRKGKAFGMVIDYGKGRKMSGNKFSSSSLKLENLMPVVSSPDSPYKDEWKKITQYQEGRESQKCQTLTCKRKEVCLLDKETQVAKCIHKKELKKAKKLVKKFYEKQKGIRVVESKNRPELGPMQMHHGKKRKNKGRKHKEGKNKETATHIRTAFDQIGEEQFHSDFVEGRHSMKPSLLGKVNEIGNSAVQDLKPECDHAEMRQMGQRLADWFYSLQQSSDPDNQLEKAKDHLLIQKQKKYKNKRGKGKGKRGKRLPRDLSDVNQQCECRDPVTWEFLHLDTDNNTLLNAGELKEVESNPFEHCVNTFIDKCDLDSSGDLSYPEWCCCFTDYLPPCFNALRNLPTQMIRGQVIVTPGIFIPKCTPQGYYTKDQCDKDNGQCWCVDNLGTERVGTRTQGQVKCD